MAPATRARACAAGSHLSDRERLPALDGLRGLAILLVLGRHATRVFAERPLAPLGRWDAATPLLNGWIGVDLFFVLSGFLIAWHLQRRVATEPEPGRLRHYAWGRALRIVPAYYVFLLVIVAGLIPPHPQPREHLAWRTTYHLLFLQDYLPADLLPTFWSLGVEMKFYLLAPLLVLPLARAPLRRAVAGYLVLFVMPAALRSLVWRAAPVTTYEGWFHCLRSPFHLSADGLFLGCLCARLYLERERLLPVTRVRLAHVLIACGGALVLALLCVRPLVETVDVFAATVLGSVLALAFGAVVLGVALAPTAAALSGPVLRFFARISYSLYLVHLALALPVSAAMAHVSGWTNLGAAARLALYLPVFAAASVAAALVLHHLVEAPFLRMKDRMQSVR